MNRTSTASNAIATVPTSTSEERQDLISTYSTAPTDLVAGRLPECLSAEDRIQFLLMQYLFSSRANYLDFCN